MRYTLLELVQTVLSSIDGDEVNSIADTTESSQVVQIIKTVYDDIQSRTDLPVQKSLFNLDASGSVLKPVLMTKPSTIDHIDWIKYNKIQTAGTDPVWEYVKFMPLDEYMSMMQSLNPSETYVDSMSHTVNGFTFSFHYRNDVSPTWYTSFNDNTMIFDGFDSAVDTTLQTSKTLGYGELTNIFVESDTWVPNLQPQQFALLLNEAKSLAWHELKQTRHDKAEQTARRNWVHLAKNRPHVPRQSWKNLNHPIHSLPNFGRRT